MSKNYFANDPIPTLGFNIPQPVTNQVQQGRFGDAVDAFQAGAISGLGGIFDFVGAEAPILRGNFHFLSFECLVYVR